VAVTDELGLVLENEHLAVYIPATSSAFVFRVRSRINRGYERLHYGPLPIPAGVPLPSYLGGSIPVPASGVMPGTAYIPVGSGLSFPLSGAFDETDMWYVPPEWRDRLFHVRAELTPRWLRVELEIPKGVVQRKFQRDKVTVGIEKTFGFSRGCVEAIHFPGIHYGYRVGNDTNLNVWTGVDFTYAEYVVEIPRDAELIFNILTRRAPSLWITMPIAVYDATIRNAFVEAYGIEGFPLYPANRRAEALRKYEELLGKVKD
jgi:hypothetical protein